MFRQIPLALLSLVAVAAMAVSGRAADPVALTLKDHHFVPAEAAAPAGERFRIEVTNQDPTPAEFESNDLKVEKIVVPGGTIGVMAGPLKPGKYGFFDDYHPEATGSLTVAEKKD